MRIKTFSAAFFFMSTILASAPVRSETKDTFDVIAGAQTIAGSTVTNSQDGVYLFTPSDSSTRLTISGSTFTNNIAGAYGSGTGGTGVSENDYNGGVIYVDNGYLAISDSTFSYNRAGYQPSVDADTGDVTWDTIAGKHGGALAITVGATPSTIDNSIFSYNEATGAGGAIYSASESLVITDTSFGYNKALGTTQTGSYGGGAIYSAGDLTINAENENVVFIGNEASAGGNDIQMGGVSVNGAVVARDSVLTLNAADGRLLGITGGIDGLNTDTNTYSVNINGATAGGNSGYSGTVALTAGINNATAVNINGGTLLVGVNDVFGVDKTTNVTVNSGATLNLGSYSMQADDFTMSAGGQLSIYLENATTYTTIEANSIDLSQTNNTDIDIRVGNNLVSKGNTISFSVFGDTSAGVIDLNETAGTGLVDTTGDQGATLNWRVGRRYRAYFGADKQLYIHAIWYDIAPELENGVDIWLGDNDFPEGSLQDQIADILQDLAIDNPDYAALHKAAEALEPNVAPVAPVVSMAINRQIFNMVSDRLTHTTGYKRSRAGQYIKREPNYANTLWAQASYGDGSFDSDYGFETNDKTLIIGFDNYLRRSLRAGLGYGYTQSEAILNSGAKDIDIDTHSVIGYMEYDTGRKFWNLIASYSMSQYTEDKHFPTIPLEAEYDVNTIALQTSYGINLGHIQLMKLYTGDVMPYGSLRYYRIDEKKYTDSAGQEVEGVTSNVLTALLGAKYDVELPLSRYSSLRGTIGAAATYDILQPEDGDRRVTIPLGATYTVMQEETEPFGVEVQASLTLNIARKVQLSLRYDGVFKSDYDNNAGTLNIRYNF